jgi:hypothetical protein
MRSRACADSCPLGTAMFFLGVTQTKRVTLITHMYTMLSVRMSGVINPLFLGDCMEWTETDVPYKCFLACGNGMCCRVITAQFSLHTLNNKLF